MIWYFGKNKKVSSRWVDVQQKRKFRKKSFFWPVASFLVENWRFVCPPMISLNGWRYEILVKTKKVLSRRVDVQQKKKKLTKSFFWPVVLFLVENWRFVYPPMISLNGWRYENLIKNEKVLSRFVNVQQKRKFRKKSFFPPVAIFFRLNEQWPISVKALLHRGLLLAHR